VNEGDLLHFDTWGGGGWGDPLERATEDVLFDVEAGLVTREGARRYGVVTNADLTVDEAATKKLRARLRRSRKSPALFDFGGTIEELKQRSEKETGLPAPKAPEFQTWVTVSTASGGTRRARRTTR
jgi:N-methylhydantoinase B